MESSTGNITQSLVLFDQNDAELPLGVLINGSSTSSTIEPLSSTEASMLENWETIIEQGEQTFIEVGKALSAINRGKLYRAQYGSFEKYCKDRWNFGRKRGYELIKAGSVAEELSAAGLHLENLTERHLRAVAKVKNTSERIQAFGRAKQMAGSKKVTSKHIEEAVDEMLGVPKRATIEIDCEVIPAQKTNIVIVPTTVCKETNGQAIERLFASIWEHGKTKELHPMLEGILNELEQRVSILLKASKVDGTAVN